MAITPPANPAERRQRLKTLTDAYRADPVEFNLLDWFYAGPGAGETIQPAQLFADYYGVPVELLSTMWWRTRGNPILAGLDDLAQAEGLYGLNDPEFSAIKWRLAVEYLEGQAKP